MTSKPYVHLGESEAAILQAAATIYAGKEAAQGPFDGNARRQHLEAAVETAVLMARCIGMTVVADGELGVDRM